MQPVGGVNTLLSISPAWKSLKSSTTISMREFCNWRWELAASRPWSVSTAESLNVFLMPNGTPASVMQYSYDTGRWESSSESVAVVVYVEPEPDEYVHAPPFWVSNFSCTPNKHTHKHVRHRHRNMRFEK